MDNSNYADRSSLNNQTMQQVCSYKMQTILWIKHQCQSQDSIVISLNCKLPRSPWIQEAHGKTFPSGRYASPPREYHHWYTWYGFVNAFREKIFDLTHPCRCITSTAPNSIMGAIHTHTHTLMSRVKVPLMSVGFLLVIPEPATDPAVKISLTNIENIRNQLKNLHFEFGVWSSRLCTCMLTCHIWSRTILHGTLSLGKHTVEGPKEIFEGVWFGWYISKVFEKGVIESLLNGAHLLGCWWLRNDLCRILGIAW